MKIFMGLLLVALGASAADTISAPAYSLVNTRASQNQTQFFVYQDVDSPFNHGFPSGLFGSSATAMGKLHTNPQCVYSVLAVGGCATASTAIDQVRGTVFQLSFDPLASGEFVGMNFEEPENWGVIQTGNGRDLTGATQLVFDAISPSGGIQVQFSVNGVPLQFSVNGGSALFSYGGIPQQWSTIAINLSSLGLNSLTGVHLLLGIASSDVNAPNGGTILLDNIRFLPVPTNQATVLGLPLANQVFGVNHVQNSLAGSIPIPPDQINSSLATLYESALAIVELTERGTRPDLVNAQLIADTLVYQTGHENLGDKLPAPGGPIGLHNGTYAGDTALFNSQGQSQGAQGGQQGQVRLAGFTAKTLCPQTGFCLVLDGATGGNNAFGVLGLLAAYRVFQNPTYLNAALDVAGWIYNNLFDSSGTGYGGYYVGYPDQGLPKNIQTGKSTENNADIFAAFSALAGAETSLGNTAAASLWTSRANSAGDFVMQMYDSGTGHFFAGTVPLGQGSAPGIYPNGSQKGNDIINTFDFLDTQTFTTLAMAPSSRYQNQIDWHVPVQYVLDHFQSSVTAAGLTFEGFDLIRAFEHMPGDGPAGIAWEFTGQQVAAMKLVDALYGTSQFSSAINQFLTQIQMAQLSAPYADGQGIVASTLQNGDTVVPYQQCLVTPSQCIAERVGLAASLWGIAAAQGLDPFLINILPTQFPTIYIDSPASNATLSGTVVVSGWAIENTGVAGPNAVSTVSVFIDGISAGTANYGLARPDVCGVFPGRLGCPNVGWSYGLNTGTVAPGSHTLKIVACDTGGICSSHQVAFTVSIPPTVYIDYPTANATLTGTVGIGGWALENIAGVGPAAVSSIAVFVDGIQVGTATYGISRPDVCAVFPGRLGCPNVGWSYSLNTAGLAAGNHTLKIVATDTTGSSSFSQLVFAVAILPTVYIDYPTANSTLTGTVGIGGWALENTAMVGPAAVSSVVVIVDGIQVGTASNVSRPDVCAAFPGRLGCPNVGWTYSLNTSGLTVGNHILKIVATDTAGGFSSSQVVFAVSISPTVYIDYPTANSTLSGTVGIGGWALENTAAVGPAAVSSVAVMVDGIQVGAATYGSARSDVCSAFPGRLGCPNVGWSYSLNTTGLAAGNHTLKIVATDTAGGSSFSQVLFAVAIPPTVYIDYPPANSTLTGTVGIGGWALENTALVGPAAVSSVAVMVDGIQVGTATYGVSRSDVCAAFPGRLGCPNVGWNYSLNTTGLSIGNHSLKIVATDTAGVAASSQVAFSK
jgi:Bacterial Ig domain